MTQAPRTVCIIPARGGSKRVPRKNVRPIDGVPMISRTVKRVLASGVVDQVVVSTDDEQIASIAEDAGALVPFRRPAHLSDDHTATAPVIEHAISELAFAPDFVVVVYATAVLLEADDLRRGRDAVARSGCDLAMSVCRYSAPIERAWFMDPDGVGRMRQPEFALIRTQDLQPSYYDAGQFYFGTAAFWTRGGDVAGVSPTLIEVPASRAIDIDTEDDLSFAELLVRSGRRR